MAVFIALCLLSRFAYSLNDVFVGQLARRYGRMEVAAWRGVSLGITMSPLLLWVPRSGWSALGARWPELLLLVTVTGIANVLQLQAARNLPFGLRAAFMIAGIAVGSLIFGRIFLGEILSTAQIGLALLMVVSSVAAALGAHASHEITPDIRKGALFAGAAAVLMAFVGLLVTRLARASDPLLVAWAWEFGAGAILVAPMLFRWRESFSAGLFGRFRKIAIASLPTVVGSGGSVLALTLGTFGVWGAIAGTQLLFTAALGVLLHKETMGALRWVCFAVAGACLSGLLLLGR
jgi:drug/metabolite transporter (DMT)-like permease